VVDVPVEVDEPPSPQPEVSPFAEPVKFRSSDEMFAELGEQMRERREALNLTRDEIERHIHLRAHYLQALEQGDFGGLPSAVQTRGMLSNYATFLDLDVDALLLGFADVLQVRHRERHPLPPGARGRPAPNVPTKMPPLRGFMVADLVGIGLVLFLAAFSVWGVQRVIRMGAQAQATAPALIDVLLEPSAGVPAGTSAPTSVLLDLGNLTATLEVLETPVGLPAIPEGVNVQINIIAVERTYLRVIADGKSVFDGRVTPGTAYPFEAGTQIEILAGNGAALRLTFNLRDMGHADHHSISHADAHSHPHACALILPCFFYVFSM
jgi:transcriptional regulator with XRE-family HTH domain